MTETEPTPEQSPEPEAAEPADEELTAASGVGALLKASRLRCGEDLRDVANSLKIRYAFLDAIEAGRFADLPGPAYAAGFVRSYADYLGLDSEEVVRRFKKEAVPAPQHRSHLDFPSPVSESGMPKAAIIFVGLLIAVAGYGGWYVTSGKSNLLKELVTPVPEELTKPAEEAAMEKPAVAETMAPVGSGDGKLFQAAPALEPKPEMPAGQPAATPAEPVAPVAQTPSPAVEAAKPVEPVAAVPAPAAAPEKPLDAKDKAAKDKEAKAKAEQEAKDKAAKEKAEAEAKAKAEQEAKDKAAKEKAEAEAKAKTEGAPAVQPAAEAAPVGNRVFGAPETEVARVVIKATSDSWIQIRDEAKNQAIATRVLRAGDTYRVPTQAGLKLATGNAGALEIRVDGKTVPSVGASGMVRRGIMLDPDRLKSGTAVDATGN